MTILKIIINSLKHYLKPALLIASGVAITTAVLTGSLIVGDSVIYSLEKNARLRLGNITHSISAGDRFFNISLAEQLNDKDIPTTPTLKLEAVASTEGGMIKLNNVNIWGVNESFYNLFENDLKNKAGSINEGIIINSSLASRLNVSPGDEINLLIKKASLIPANAPFVSDNKQVVSYRTTVSKILPAEGLGRLSLQNTQTALFNVFISLDILNNIMELENKANILLISTEKDKNYITETLRSEFTLENAGLKIRQSDASNQWELISDRVFIDDATSQAVINTGIPCTKVFTYFFNGIRKGEKETPYSFVSTLPENNNDSIGITINTWLSEDLNLKRGDTVLMSYYTIGPLRELTENEKYFIVRDIKNMEGWYGDRTLMPEIPGLSDAENCRDWNTGVPINLKSIKKTDEDYWYNYRGLPKAFIDYNTAQKIWENRFGSVTSYRFNREDISEEELLQSLKDQIDPISLGFIVRNVKEEGLYAAENGTDFSSLFFGLSFFIIAASLILTALFFKLFVERRISEIGTLQAIGFSNKKILRIYMSEGIVIATAGALAGILLAFIYNEIIFLGLNRIWNDIVRTDILVSKYKITTLITGFILSVIISAITIRFQLNSFFRQNSSNLQRQISYNKPEYKLKIKKWFAVILMLFTAVVIILQLTGNGNINSGLFFISGGFALISLVLISDIILSSENKNKEKSFTVSILLIKNLRFNKQRNLVIIIVLAIATFIVVTTGLNRKNVFVKNINPKSGTGGYMWVAESTIPILHDINNPDYRKEQGITEKFNAVQFSIADGDDASCLNLNRITNPRIMGVDASLLEGRFSFQSFSPEIKEGSGWEILKNKYNDCIPAIADQTVIQWGLGKKPGDTLTYINSKGEEIYLLLVAGLKPSIFQGNIIIDSKNFLENYPTKAGSNFFLIDGDQERKQEIAEEFSLLYRENGIEIKDAQIKLAEFLSVENTYLSIFLILGALGLLIGTAGISVVLQRSLYERNKELSLLASLGFRNKLIIKITVYEYIILLIWGEVIGFVTALLAVFPIFVSSIMDISPLFVLVIILIIIVNGILWIYFPAKSKIKNMKLIEGLRND
ncbi:MAG: FtsX-like permease family protein [Prolixibacteraceae bacterium]|nr:FtsX-like permease family protein [Prolixibacteraceae bacterium]